MIRFLVRSGAAIGALIALGVAFATPLTTGETPTFLAVDHFGGWFVTAVIAVAALAAIFHRGVGPVELWLGLASLASVLYLYALLGEAEGHAAPGFWALAAAGLLICLQFLIRLGQVPASNRWLSLARMAIIPSAVAVLMLVLWEVAIRGSGLSPAIPAPSAIASQWVGWPASAAATAVEEPAE